MEGKPEKALQLYTYALKYLPEARPGRQVSIAVTTGVDDADLCSL